MRRESKLELLYFNMRGRAEAARLLLTIVDAPFEDHRVRNMQHWGELKPQLPFGSLPLFRSGSFVLSQSHAILRYIAGSYELLPSSFESQSVYDEAHLALSEAQEDLWQFAWRKDYVANPKAYAEGRLSHFLENLQSHLIRHGGECWVGNSISHIDCLAYVLLDELRAFFPTVLSSFTSLYEFHARFENRPPIRTYIDSGRRPVVFGMALHGPKIDPAANVQPGEVFENPWTEPVPLA
ncbi:MAG: glutathione S-transferase family protein [Gammaproteobacteria bacterium]|nr:glutathione S-transferase family protein [Gammaproteobacteria bacterium]MCZ6855036.1 glutathione S-transferase family protein [Gammaproteobacteria bacterium]